MQIITCIVLTYYSCAIPNFRYPSLLPFSSPGDLNKLGEEFLDYQMMERTELPESVWKSALVVDGKSQYYRMDEVWTYLSSMKSVDGTLRFPMLTKVAQLVLVLPHSNAQEERVFSLVTKNKTMFRPNLKLDGDTVKHLDCKAGQSRTLF